MRKKMSRMIQSLLAWIVILSIMPSITSNAAAQCVSDGMMHEEGYIVIGSSHAVLAGYDMVDVTDENHKVIGLEDVYYSKVPITEVAFTGNGKYMEKDYEMSGNLFFVCEGLHIDKDNHQATKEYIYSDGKGNCGEGVQAIHKVIDANPNIKHWNIISYQGSAQAALGRQDIADYYVQSYKNWISYEFPEADCYFLSHPLISKMYRGKRNLDLFDRTLAQAFPDQFMDYTEYYKERYPSGMRDPSEKGDSVHWNADTYVGLIKDVIQKIQAKRAEYHESQKPVETTPVNLVLYTNENTVIKKAPRVNAQIILASCEQGLPIQVTGITDTGFYEISLGGEIYYIEASGLSGIE